MTIAEAEQTRADFNYFHTGQIRWNDLDPYCHLNNARYYAFFDTLIMHYLTVDGGFDLLTGSHRVFTVENGCRFHRSFIYPDSLECGLRVAKLGRSSVRYEIGLFRANKSEIYASGHFVDVFVDAQTERPTEIPAPIRTFLARIQHPSPDNA